MSGRVMLTLIAAVAMLAAACNNAPPTGGPGPSAAAGGTLRIGFTSSQTGSLNKESKEQTQGLQLWANDVNGQGGIAVGDQRYQVQLVSYDDESVQDRVQQLYTRLITDDKVDFLISPYGSASAAASMVVTEQYGKTNLVVGAASYSIFQRGYRHVFQVYSPAGEYLTGALDLLRAQNPSANRIVLVNENEPFSTDVIKAARDYAEQQGFDIVLQEAYETGTADFAPLINKIAGENPDAILGGGHFADGSALARQLWEKQVKVGLVALLVAPGQPEFKDLGDAALGIVGPSQWEPQVTYSASAAEALGIPYTGPAVTQFTQRYQDTYGYEPGYIAAGGYATGVILERAISDAGSVDPTRVEAALAKTDMMSFFGRTKFDTQKDFGLEIGHNSVVLQWQRGSAGLVKQIVWPLAAATQSALYPKP